MSSLLPIFVGVLERGFISSLVVMSFYLSSRILKFDDFTLEGTFGLGGALCALCLLSGMNPWLSLFVCLIGGGLSGSVTGILHAKFQFNRLIAGVVVATMLFSFNLALNGPNVALSNKETLFKLVSHFVYGNVILLCILAFCVAAFFTWFLKTEIGYFIRSTGLNAQFVTSMGKNINFYIILTLTLTNALSAVAGGIIVQYTGFYSAFGNVGILIASLAGCILGELFTIPVFFASIIGSILYQLIIALTIELQVDSSWQKLITGLLIIFILVLKKIQKKGLKHAQA